MIQPRAIERCTSDTLRVEEGSLYPALYRVEEPLTYIIGRMLLNAWMVDDLNPAVKRFVVFVLAFAISAALHAAGQEIPADRSAITSGDLADSCVSVLTSDGFLSALLAAGLGSAIAFLMHAQKKAGPAT